MAVNQIQDPRRATRHFFFIIAVAFPLIVLAGFARTYYLKVFFGTPPVASLLVHLHGFVMTAWIALFVTQIWLISSKRIKLHQRLGIASIALAVLVFAVGTLTAISAAKYGSASSPPDIPPLAFLVVPFFDMILFLVFFGFAIYYWRRPANHKRMILLTAFNFLPPAIARIPIGIISSLGPLAFFGIPDVLAITFVAVDTWKHGKLNKPFALGALLLIASHPLRLMLSGTDAWMLFAAWLTS